MVLVIISVEVQVELISNSIRGAAEEANCEIQSIDFGLIKC